MSPAESPPSDPAFLPLHDRLGRSAVGFIPTTFAVQDLSVGPLGIYAWVAYSGAGNFSILSLSRLKRRDGRPLGKGPIDLARILNAALTRALQQDLIRPVDPENPDQPGDGPAPWQAYAALVRASRTHIASDWPPAADAALMEGWRAAVATEGMLLEDVAAEFGATVASLRRRLVMLRKQHGEELVPRGPQGRVRKAARAEVLGVAE